MTLGFGLSIAAMSSCRFVEVDGVTDYGEEFSGVGLYWFESPDGQCFFMDPGFDPQDFDLQDLDATDFGASDLDFWVAGKLIVARVFSATCRFWESTIRMPSGPNSTMARPPEASG